MVAVLLLGAAAGAGLVALLPAASPAPGPEPGRTLYGQHCATCHGADGRGGTWRARILWLDPGDLAAVGVAALPDQYLQDVIRHGGSSLGKPGMPSFGFALSDEDIRALVVYLRALAARGDARRPRAPGPAQGRKISGPGPGWLVAALSSCRAR
jgi:mono/diheme cytochrome c family protein